MAHFDHILPELEGFSAYYNTHIAPTLESDEQRRKAAISKMWTRIPMIGVLCMGVAILVWSQFKTPVPLVAGVMFSVFGAATYVAYVLKDISSDTKSLLMNNVCNFLGWEFSAEVVNPPDLLPLTQNGLLTKAYHRSAFEDRILGSAHGADFEMLECHLEKKVKSKNGTRWVTTFRGAILALDFHREFIGRTVVLRDKGIFNSKKKDGMKRVGLVDPVFEKVFEAYGTDQVEARYLLTPDFMQQLVDLETSVDGKNIRFAFLNELLLVVVETPNRFEAGSMFKPLVDTARTQKILNEVAAVYGVVDGVMKKPQSPFRSSI